MTISELIREKRQDILRIARTHGVNRVRLFGSVARGEARAESDVDFLIEVSGPTTPWFPGGLVADLEELLGRRVDVIEAETLADSVRENIKRDAVPL